MENVLRQPLETWAFALLLFARVVSMISLAPVFGGRTVPALARIGFSALLAFLFSLVVPRPAFDVTSRFLSLLPSEALVGFGIGFVAMMVFQAVQMAGHLIDVPMGFSMVNVFDPNTDTQLPVMGDFYYVLSMLIFLVTNAHHHLINALLESFSLLGLGQSIRGDLLTGFADTFARMFLLGVKISIPVVGVMLMSDAAIALLSRTVPSLNAFILGAPVKIVLGVVTMMFTLVAFIAFVGNLLHNVDTGMFYEIFYVLGLLRGGS